MALAITTQPCCLLFQPLVQELGYVSVDTIFQMKAHIRRYVNEKHDVATAAKIGPQCVRVATAFLFALVCEYGAV